MIALRLPSVEPVVIAAAAAVAVKYPVFHPSIALGNC
jgi:hypothetical protein